MTIEVDPILGSTRTSFSGVDIEVYACFVGDNPNIQSKAFKLDTLTALTLSSFREKVPVRSLGNTNAIGYTRGPRTYAGTIVTTLVGEHPFAGLLNMGEGIHPLRSTYDFSYDERARRLLRDRRYGPDSLPPLNLIVQYANEYGQRVFTFIYGVEFTHDGTTQSVEDMYTEMTYQYIARDAVYLAAAGTSNPPAGLDYIEWDDSMGNPGDTTPDRIAALITEQSTYVPEAGQDVEIFEPVWTQPPRHPYSLD